MRRRLAAPPRPVDLCREDVGLMLALKAGISGKRGDEFRVALSRWQDQVRVVSERWTQHEIATVLANPQHTATQYALVHEDLNERGAARMLAWASRLPTREDF